VLPPPQQQEPSDHWHSINHDGVVPSLQQQQELSDHEHFIDCDSVTTPPQQQELSSAFHQL